MAKDIKEISLKNTKEQNLKNLQQQQFKEIVQKMSIVSGWKILEDDDLLALKSPVTTPLLNMVWGNVTEKSYTAVMDFYKKAEFYWLLDINQINNIPNQFKQFFTIQADSKFPEMVFNLQNYTSPKNSPEIDIIVPTTKNQLQLWTETAIATLGIDKADWQQFFYPLIELANNTPLLLYYNQQPAGTAMVYCGQQIAGIYAMTTKVEFRRNKIGSSAVNACLQIAHSHNLSHAVLYASKMGTMLYHATGFEVSQYFYEFSFNSMRST